MKNGPPPESVDRRTLSQPSARAGFRPATATPLGHREGVCYARGDWGCSAALPAAPSAWFRDVLSGGSVQFGTAQMAKRSNAITTTDQMGDAAAT